MPEKSPPHAGALVPLTYGGKSIRDRGETVNLTDMWRASGSDPARKPGEWLRSADAVRFIDFLATTLNVGISHHDLVQTERGGRSPATWAHWQIGLAYAKYLRPEFHVWANTAVRERMEQIRDTPRIAGNPGDPATVLQVIQHLQAQITAQGPRVAALERLESAEGSRCITDAAKMLKMPQAELRRWMVANRWIYQRAGTETWVAYREREQALLLEHVPYRYTGRDGTPRVKMQVLVTPKGLTKLATIVGRKG